MDMTLLKEGAFIMIIGMGMVFFFLTLMIGAMNVSEVVIKFIGKFFPEEIPEIKTTKVAKKKSETSDDEIALTVACAVHNAQKV